MKYFYQKINESAYDNVRLSCFQRNKKENSFCQTKKTQSKLVLFLQNILKVWIIFFLYRIICMVSDQQLYELIKKAVREKRMVPHHETQNFAERYCSQQLAKKKLKTQHNHQKMDYIMKNFAKLETYFDLPQLLNSIHVLKLKKQNDKITTSPKPEQKQPRSTTKNLLNRHFSDLKNLRYVFESEDVQQMLADVEFDNQWKSENLKNNSNYNLDSLFSRVHDQKESDTLKKENDNLFELLRKYKDNQREFLHNQKEESIKQTELNSEKKKQYTNFLHKVSSFLQIILETQHRSKWKKHHKSRSSGVKKNLHCFASIYEQKYKQKQNSPKKPVINPKLSHTRCVEVLKEEARKIRQSQENKSSHLPKMKTNNTYHAFSRFLTEDLQKSFDKKASFLGNSSNQSQKSSIKQNFTFKRRSIKQKIISKLGRFIGEIDDESHCSRKENNYYNKEINKLEVQFKHLYGRYKRETLAGQKDIAVLKQLASQFAIKNCKENIDQDGGPNFTTQTQILKAK